MALDDPLHLPWKLLADLTAAEATKQDGKPRVVMPAKSVWLPLDEEGRLATMDRMERMGGFFVIPVEDLPMFTRPEMPDSPDDM